MTVPTFYGLPLNRLFKTSAQTLAGMSLLMTSLLVGGEGAIAQSLPATGERLLFAQVPTQAPAATTLLSVDPTLGNDNNPGTFQAPFRTITRALQVAPANSAILLTPGTYSTDTGEVFPLALRPGVTLQGDVGTQGEGIVIRGGGAYLSRSYGSQNVTVVGSSQAMLAGVTVVNPNPRGYGLWLESTSPIVMNNTFSRSTHDGIAINGTAEALIQGNVFRDNGANGITIYGSARPHIRHNLFERTGTGISIAQDTAPIVTHNRITDNRNGIVVQANARPVLRNNTIEGNREAGLVAIAQSVPNLGTADDPGNNIFRNNGEFDINARVNHQPVPAAGNQLTEDRVVGEVDLSGTVVPTPAPATSVSRSSAPAPVPIPTTPAARSLTPAPSSPSPSTGLSVSTPFPRPTSPPAASVVPSRPSNTLPAVSSVTATATAPVTPRPASNAIAIAVTPPPATSTPASTSPGSIAIPVIPPPSGSGPSGGGQVISFQATSAPQARPTPVPTAIEIPVSLPEMAIAASPLPVQSSPINAAISAPRPNANLLPVPSADIPVGNVGSLPRISVAQGYGASSGNWRSTSLGLRYRVVIEASSERIQDQVRSIVPGAFRTQVDGRTMMQAGAYSDRANADDAAQTLSRYGLRVLVLPME